MELPVWSASRRPSFLQTKLTGPAPRGVVLNVAVRPKQSVWFAIGVAVVGALMVSVALLVTELHSPLTTTVSVSASSTDTLLSNNELWVPPSTTLPSLRQR